MFFHLVVLLFLLTTAVCSFTLSTMSDPHPFPLPSEWARVIPTLLNPPHRPRIFNLHFAFCNLHSAISLLQFPTRAYNNASIFLSEPR